MVTALLLVGGISLSSVQPASAASSVVQQSTSLHGDVMTMLNGYLQAYGSELSAADRSRVSSMMDRAELSLARLDVAVRAIPAARTSKARRAAITAALARQAEAKAAATSGMTEVTPLLSSHMNVFELLSAKRDADRLMGRLDDLGSAIRAA